MTGQLQPETMKLRPKGKRDQRASGAFTQGMDMGVDRNPDMLQLPVCWRDASFYVYPLITCSVLDRCVLSTAHVSFKPHNFFLYVILRAALNMFTVS